MKEHIQLGQKLKGRAGCTKAGTIGTFCSPVGVEAETIDIDDNPIAVFIQLKLMERGMAINPLKTK